MYFKKKKKKSPEFSLDAYHQNIANLSKNLDRAIGIWNEIPQSDKTAESAAWGKVEECRRAIEATTLFAKGEIEKEVGRLIANSNLENCVRAWLDAKDDEHKPAAWNAVEFCKKYIADRSKFAPSESQRIVSDLISNLVDPDLRLQRADRQESNVKFEKMISHINKSSKDEADRIANDLSERQAGNLARKEKRSMIDGSSALS